VSTSQVGNKIRDHFRACGIEGEGAVHRLRYSFGTNLARSGAQMRVVQDLLRHASLETTMRYVAVDSDEKVAAMRMLVA
jgi:integrase/recombinase XerD